MVHTTFRVALASWVAAIVAFATAPDVRAQEPTIGIAQGEMHPDFLLRRVDGTNGRLSDYRGKKVLLFHFASW